MGEIVSIQQADQFLPGKTAYACGFFAVAECCSIAKPGQAPTKTAAWIQENAEAWYAQYDGDNSTANEDGMSLEQLYLLLSQVGLHWQAIALDANTLRGWLRAGYPIAVGVAETAVYDLDLGSNPYPWTPSGYHVIVLTGLDGNNFLARDSANISPPNNLRPGPRRYGANKLVSGLVSATVVVPPWMPRPTSATPPQPIPEKPKMIVPQGWHDNGTELVAPNNIPVVAGFRDEVLNWSGGWDAGNWPLEPEQHLNEVELAIHSGAGSRQIFRTCMLVWYASRGVKVAWVGNELFAWMHKAEAQPTTLPTDLRNQLAVVQNLLTPVANAVTTIDTVLKTK